MPRDGSGNYTLPSGNPVVTNTIISSNGWANPTLSDIASAITQSLSRDGQTTPTANLTMGNFRLTNLGNASARTDAVNAGQIQDNQLVVLSSIGGTGDAITASTAPAITAYTTNAIWYFTPTSSNTLTNPTININAIGAKTITQSNGLGLWTGALVVGTPYELLYDGTNFRVQSGQLGVPIPVSGSQLGFRNRFIDGNFAFWDSGTSFVISNAATSYCATMWGFTAGAGVGINASAALQTINSGISPGNFTTPCTTFLQFVQAPGAGVGGSIFQRIEDVATLSGQSATLSLWLWTNGGTVTIPSVFANQNCGAGGSGAFNTNVTTNWLVTSVPQRFSVRIDVPSISGKTIGTGNYLAVGITMPNSTSLTVNTTQWQLEDCPTGAPSVGIPTPFEFKGYDVERIRVTRFLNVIASGGSGQGIGLATATSATNAACVVYFPPMRAVPALSIPVGSASNLVLTNFPGTTVTGLSLVNVSNVQNPIISARIDATFSGTAPTLNTVSTFKINTVSTTIVLDARL